MPTTFFRALNKTPMGMPVILSCSLSLCRADVFFAMPTKPVAKKPIPGKPQAVRGRGAENCEAARVALSAARQVSEDRCQDPLRSRNLEEEKQDLDVSGPAA
jgi:hypothetical protein